MKLKRALSMLLVLALCIALPISAGLAEAAPKTGGTLLMSLGAEPTNLNPNGNYDANNGYIVQNCFNRLIKLNSMQEVLPDLAKSYEVSADGLTYTFHLYDNVLFSDGQKLTSDDVKFTFETIRDKQTFAAYVMAQVDAIECPDEFTVVFKMKAVDAAFLYNVAYQGTFILPRHAYEGKDWMGADALQTPVGTGPFVFDAWDKGMRITLKKNPSYFMGPDVPYLDQVIFAFVADATTAKVAFLAGEYDIQGVFASTDYNEMRANPNIVLEVNIYPSRFLVGFNLAQKPFDDLKLRQAIAAAINKDEMMAIALKEVGLKAEHFLSPLFQWAVDDSVTVPAFDLDKAKQLIAETGLTKDADGFYLKATLDTMNYSPFPDLAQVFKSQMAAVGIDVTINMLEYASFDEKVVKNKDFQLALTSDYQGPEVSAIGNSVSSTGYMNYMGYNNPEVDKLLADALNKASFEERAPLYKEVQAFMAQDLPYDLLSEWIGYFPHWDYVKGHPGGEEARGKTGYAEFTYVWLDK